MDAFRRGRMLDTTSTSLAIIDVIEAENGATINEIADEIDLAKSTVHGHLATLLHHRYIVRNNGEYHLGMRFLSLGQVARTRDELYDIAGEQVSDLAKKTGEGVDFSVAEHGRIITLYNEVNSPRDPNFDLGKQFYMHNSAAGKAILAEYPDEWIRDVIDRWGMPKETNNTITDADELFDQIEEIRDQGYAYVDEEFRKGVRAVGKTILNPDGSVFGAFSIGGPAYRISGGRFHEELPNDLAEAVTEIEGVIETNRHP